MIVRYIRTKLDILDSVEGQFLSTEQSFLDLMIDLVTSKNQAIYRSQGSEHIICRDWGSSTDAGIANAASEQRKKTTEIWSVR